MPTTVDIPDVGRVEFPEGMTEDQISTAIFTKIKPPEESPTDIYSKVRPEEIMPKTTTELPPQAYAPPPVKLPQFGQPGTITRGASQAVTGLGEFAINNPEEFLGSFYPPAGMAVLAEQAPGMVQQFAGDVWKGVHGDKEALGRAGTTALLLGLPLGAHQYNKARAAALEAERTQFTGQTQDALNQTQTDAARTVAVAPVGAEIPLVLKEIPGPEPPAGEDAAAAAAASKAKPPTVDSRLAELKLEGVKEEDAQALIAGTKTPKEVVESNIGGLVRPAWNADRSQVQGGHAEAWIEGYNQAISRLTDILDRGKPAAAASAPPAAPPAAAVPESAEDVTRRAVPWGQTAEMELGKDDKQQRQIFTALSQVFGSQAALDMTAGKRPYPSLEDFNRLTESAYLVKAYGLFDQMRSIAAQFGKIIELPKYEDYPNAEAFYRDMFAKLGEVKASGTALEAAVLRTQPKSTVAESAPPAAAPTAPALPPATGEKASPVEPTPKPAGAPAVPAPVDPIEKFTKAISDIPDGAGAPKRPLSQAMGISPTAAITGVIDASKRVAQVAGSVLRELGTLRKFTPFREAINAWSGKVQLASLKIRKMQADLESKVPSALRREAISNWIQADGDVSLLRTWEHASTTMARKEGYRAAQSLTPEEIRVAQAVRNLYDNMLTRAQAHDIVEHGLENYVTQIWKQPVLGAHQMVPFLSKLSRTFKFGKKRTFENFFEGEQAGFKPVTKDISKLLGLYLSEMEKTIATRELIKDLTTKTASDGNPLAKPEGMMRTTEADPSSPSFIQPGVVKGDVRYEQIDHPALAKWKWAGVDPENGRQAFILGELRAHPEIAAHLRNVLGGSEISRFLRTPSQSATANVLKATGRAVETAGRVTKEVMLGTLSLFHHVQEGTHAIGHKVSPITPNPLPIDLPEFKDALSHGLQLAGDRAAMESFREGLGAKDIFHSQLMNPFNLKIGKFIQAHNDFLFNEYIPRLKWNTYQHILERNMGRYTKDLAAGKVTEGDVKALSAEQTNAAYGHLNYADLGRDPTVQHVLRLAALAPDFLEARTRFSLQAAKGVVSKAGQEQLATMVRIGATFYIGARIANKLVNDDWNTDEPFGVRVGNRTYRMRTVPEDIWRAFKDTRQFAYGRLSPVFGRTAVELMSGVNFRGEKIPASEAFKEAITSWVPIQMRGAPGFKNLSATEQNATISAWEQMWGSMGLQISRYSPINKTHQLATEWRKTQGEAPAYATYPVSKFQQLRYHLEDGDLQGAADEIEKLTQGGKVSPGKIAEGFQHSLYRPFSGSATTEPAFLKSLTEDQKKLYQEAVQQRSRIWHQFGLAQKEHAARRQATKSATNNPTGGP